MQKIYRLDDGRISFFGMLIENSNKDHCNDFGLMVTFEDWEIVVSIGYLFGTIWFQIPHKFLFRVFPKVFHGEEGYGKWGREIGFKISRRSWKYKLWWWACEDCPKSKWREGFGMFKIQHLKDVYGANYKKFVK